MKVNFNDIYEIIYKSLKKSVSELKIKLLSEIILWIGIFLMFFLILMDNVFDDGDLFIFYYIVSIPLFVMSSIIMIFSLIKKFKKICKSLVIETLVKQYNKSFNYSHIARMSDYEYGKSKFDKRFDFIYSEDMIEGKLKTGNLIKMAEVSAFIGNKNEKSNISIFEGIYGYVELNKNISNNMIIKSNKIIEAIGKQRYNKIELESSEFEKKFDFFATDKIEALKIFTPDLIDKIILLDRELENSYEMKIENNMIYFRCPLKNAFETKIFRDDIDFSLLYKYFNLINYPVEIIEEVIKKN